MNTAERAALKVEAAGARERLDEIDRILAKKEEVWAYIGTEVECVWEPAKGGIVLGCVYIEKVNLFSLRIERGPRPPHWGQMADFSISGQPVTHFQPIKAEIRRSNEVRIEGRDVWGAWGAWINDEVFAGWHQSKSIAESELRKFAKSIAPWWSGELVITERD